ncbi:hypothetical protein [Halarchaeum acidiphilum]|nr:hypothetical protein [Halarchaeum acidiphilum]
MSAAGDRRGEDGADGVVEDDEEDDARREKRPARAHRVRDGVRSRDDAGPSDQ